MSRAFVKEPDGDSPEDLPELPLSPHPNYVTEAGLEQLRKRLGEAERELESARAGAVDETRALAERWIRWLRARIAGARLVTPPDSAAGRVVFGATVTLQGPDGSTQTYRIVGEDEADPAHGLVSWVSPLASALMGAKIGDVVTWTRPSGAVEVEVRGISYGAPPAG